nr:hypothetical protein [Tanacetum cinerariifolium]
KGGSTKELVSTARPKDSTVRLDMKEEKAKENGVSIKDIEEFLRPARSILTLKPLPTIDPKDKGKDAKVVRLVYEEELAELEREKEKRQREEEAFKAALAEMYDEVQAGIEADALVINDFKPMDSDDAVDKEKVLKEPDSTKVEVKQGGDEESIRKRPGKRLKMKATKKSKGKRQTLILRRRASKDLSADSSR